MKTRGDILLEAKKLLHGREIGSEVLEKDEAWLKSADLIVLFGASDDLVEIRGAIHDEVGAYDGTVVPFRKGQLYKPVCEAEDCPHEENLREGTIDIKANWSRGDVSWSFETEIPHEVFDVLEDGAVFCKGIIFCRESVDS
jgi:hypothetical protein